MPISILRAGSAHNVAGAEKEKSSPRWAVIAAYAVLPALVVVFGLGSYRPGPQSPGYRHDGFYIGSTGILWPSDHGVLAGRCDRPAAAEGDTLPVAALGGPLFAGARTGTDDAAVDAGDRACMAQSLELATGAHDVAWRNARTHAEYRVAPSREYVRGAEICRRFVLQMSADNGRRRIASAACTQGDGAWRVVERAQEMPA